MLAGAAAATAPAASAWVYVTSTEDGVSGDVAVPLGCSGTPDNPDTWVCLDTVTAGTDVALPCSDGPSIPVTWACTGPDSDGSATAGAGYGETTYTVTVP